MIAYLLFEQSGTFKKEFKKLGIDAYDYDILNDFNETDYQIDLFNEIEKGYNEEPSIFDNISNDDIIMAFFPCIRFENQAIMMFRGDQFQLQSKSDIEKLELDLKYHQELHRLYTLVTKLTIVAYKRGLKLIIENPYSPQHYLTRYWAIKPKIIDKDRKKGGDYCKKPTQYFFINFEPKCNLLMDEAYFHNTKVRIIEYMGYANHQVQVQRSMIHPEYARRFIREYIL